VVSVCFGGVLAVCWAVYSRFSICWVLLIRWFVCVSMVSRISSSTVICWVYLLCVYLFVMVCVVWCLVYRVYGGRVCVSVVVGWEVLYNSLL